MQNKNIWQAQLKDVNRALELFICCDEKYRGGFGGSMRGVTNRVQPIIRSVTNTDFTNYLVSTDYCDAPASLDSHGAFIGGLVCHSLLVAKRLLEFTLHNNLEWQRVQSPVLIGMLHDLCEVGKYTMDEDGKYQQRTNKIAPIHGHAEKSLAFIVSHGLQITEEEMLCIAQHRGAYNVDAWQEYDAAIHIYPNVLWAHTADMYASKIDGV